MVDLRIALVSAITAMTGAWIGTKIIFLLPEESIQKAITVALPVIALIMVLRKTDARNVIMRSEISKKTVVQALIVGVIMGFYNSLFGPGIGTVAIIAFTMIMHYDARCASGNGKVLIVLTNAIALVSYVKTGNVAYEIACPAALCAIAGNLVGVNLAIRKGEKIIKPVMLVVVILTVITHTKGLVLLWTGSFYVTGNSVEFPVTQKARTCQGCAQGKTAGIFAGAGFLRACF